MSRDPEESLAARIARTLADRIISGVIAPDTWLRQDHIAEEFGTSHVPVREAFRQLEAQGLIISLRRRGVRVTGVAQSEVQEVAEMRAALEVLALRKAAPHLTASHLEEAEQATIDCERAEDVRVWEQANRHFHRVILGPCAMPRLMAAVDDLHDASARFLFAGWQSEWQARPEHDHRAILAALRMAQVEQAAMLLSRHILFVKKVSAVRGK